jgi:hypothetical protein
VLLRSFYKDSKVRTIVSQWDGNNSEPGWSLGVTSERSKYKPGNLILQLTGDPSKGGGGYEVIASDLRLELDRPYYVAASVRFAGRRDGDEGENAVTFHMKDQDGNVRRVVYPRPKPNNFEQATQLVVIGEMRNNVFHAHDMLMKCPSKYNDGSELINAQDS